MIIFGGPPTESACDNMRARCTRNFQVVTFQTTWHAETIHRRNKSVNVDSIKGKITESCPQGCRKGTVASVTTLSHTGTTNQDGNAGDIFKNSWQCGDCERYCTLFPFRKYLIQNWHFCKKTVWSLWESFQNRYKHGRDMSRGNKQGQTVNRAM